MSLHHRRADRSDGAAGDRVRPPPTVRGIDWGQVDRDIYEPMLGPMVQQQLADRPELLAKLSGQADMRHPDGLRRWRQRLIFGLIVVVHDVLPF